MNSKPLRKVLSVYPILLQSIQGYADQDIEVVYDQQLYNAIVEASKLGNPIPIQYDLIKIYELNLALATRLKEQGFKVSCMSVQDQFVPVAFLINQKLKLSGPNFSAAFYLKNKLLMRQLIDEKFWFEEVDITKSMIELQEQAQNVNYPAYMKPTLDCGSRGQGKVQNPQEFIAQVKCWQSQGFANQIVKFFQNILKEQCPHIPQYMIEQYVDTASVQQFSQDVQVGPDPQQGFRTILYLNQNRYRKGKYSVLACESFIDLSSEQLIRAEQWLAKVLKKLLDQPKFNFKNYVLNVEMWRLPDGTFKIVEINARAGYAVNMMISSIFNSNFSVSCYRVIAGLPRRPEEEYFKRLIELRKENRNLSKSSMCLYIHYKGTGRVEDIFDFNFLDTYVNDIEKQNGSKRTYEYHQVEGEYFVFKKYQPRDKMLENNYETRAGHQLIFESMVLPETQGENSVMKAWHQHFARIVKDIE